MRRIFSGVLASVLALSATAAFAQTKPPLKLGGILDMSGLYADITGPDSETAGTHTPRLIVPDGWRQLGND